MAKESYPEEAKPSMGGSQEALDPRPVLEHTLLSMGIRAPRLGEFQMLAGDWGTGDFRSPSGESSATGDCGLQLSSQSLTRELC